MSIIKPEDMPPNEIVEHALALQEYFEKQGHRTWQLMGVCSRDHSGRVAVLKTALEFYAKESNWFGAPAPVYQDSGAIARTTLGLPEEP